MFVGRRCGVKVRTRLRRKSQSSGLSKMLRLMFRETLFVRLDEFVFLRINIVSKLIFSYDIFRVLTFKCTFF